LLGNKTGLCPLSGHVATVERHDPCREDQSMQREQDAAVKALEAKLKGKVHADGGHLLTRRGSG
jgi:hypothetical protein